MSLSACLERTVKMTLWGELLGHMSSNLSTGFRRSFDFKKKLQSNGWISHNFKLVTTLSAVKMRRKLHGNFCLKARAHCRVALLKQKHALHLEVRPIWEVQWQNCSCIFKGTLTESLHFLNFQQSWMCYHCFKIVGSYLEHKLMITFWCTCKMSLAPSGPSSLNVIIWRLIQSLGMQNPSSKR